MFPLHRGAWGAELQLRLWTDIPVAPVIGPSHWLVTEWLGQRQKTTLYDQRRLLGRHRCYNERKMCQYVEWQKCRLVFLLRPQMSLRVDRTRTSPLRNQATHSWDGFSTCINSSELKNTKAKHDKTLLSSVLRRKVASAEWTMIRGSDDCSSDQV